MRRLSLLLLGLATLLTIHPARAASFTIQNVQVSHDRFAAHSEPAMAENPRNRRDLVAGSKFFTNPKKYQFKIGTYYSRDGGRTWHDNGFLPGFGAYSLTSDISFAFSSTGVAYACVLALNGKTSGIFVSRSTDGGATWSAPATVFLDSTGATFSDKPWIAVDTSGGAGDGNVYVAWNLDAGGEDVDGGKEAVRAAAPAVTGLVVAHSTDGGHTFSAPVVIQQFTRDSFSIGTIPAVGPDGSIYVAYTVLGNSSTTLDMVVSHDAGVTFSTPQVVQQVDGLPDHLNPGTFRNLTLPTFAVSPLDGTLLVAWADMRNGDADVLSTASTDGGTTWSAPVRVNDDPKGDGKDQFQPELAVAPNGTFTCAFFDRRRDPKNYRIDEEIAQSSNDGTSWGTNLRVTAKSWDPAIDAPEPGGKPTETFIGDYQALAVDNRAVHPLWNDTQNSRSQQIRTAVMSESVFTSK